MRLMDFVAVKETLPPEADLIGVTFVRFEQGIPAWLVERMVRFWHKNAFRLAATHCRTIALWGQGGPLYSQRVADVRSLLDAGFSIAWCGPDGAIPLGCELHDWQPPEKLPQWAATHAVACMSVGLRSDVQGYHSDSLLLALASGLPVLKRDDGSHSDWPCFTYQNTAQLVQYAQKTIDGELPTEALRKRVFRWLKERGTLQTTVRILADLIAKFAAGADLLS